MTIELISDNRKMRKKILLFIRALRLELEIAYQTSGV